VRDPVIADDAKRRLAVAFAAEEARGFRLFLQVRLGTLAFVGLWLTLENPVRSVVYLLAYVAGFAVIGLIPVVLRRRGRWRPWHAYLFALLDAALLTVAILAPNPLDDTPNPLPQRFAFGNDLYYYLFIVGSTFSYSPHLVWWTGVASALCWSVGGLIVLTSPGAFTLWTADAWLALSPLERVEMVGNPHLVNVGRWGRQVVMLLLTSWGLAVLVWRVRQLVERQALAERARANLARYFSANMVEDLAAADLPLGPTTSQDCAILFADVVGFTSFAAGRPAQAVIDFLRDFHARMERAVFDHDGTLDKYIGDGVMATFGTPRRGPRDATNALACAFAMIAAVQEWNAARTAAGEPPVRIGVGVHHGPVVLGDIGGPHRFEFAAVGDSVNVASRLERLTRVLQTDLVASEALLAAVRDEEGAADLLARLEPAPDQTLRGRDGRPLGVWRLPPAAAVTNATATADRA
jgi:adenylate cyclase